MRRLFPRAACCALLLLAGLVPVASAADRAQTRTALAREMRSAGPGSGALAFDLTAGRTIYARRADVTRVPASVNKLHTTSALLRRLGPGARLYTDVLLAAPAQEGVVTGNLYLRGGGDPTFGAGQARRLARALAASGIRRITGRVMGDESLFDALRGPSASGFQTSRWVGPLSALAYERGLTGARPPRFQSRPALFAARGFERQLRRHGIRIDRGARAGVTPSGATLVMRMPSPTMRALAAHTNLSSDNFAAETLLKVLGARFAGSGTTAAGSRVVREAMAELGVRPRVVDGSGLSRANRTTPAAVVRLLRGMDRSSDGAAFEASLPVAGRSGTLRQRMRRTAAARRCRAKTGSLSGVSALAGYCTTISGGRVAFAFLMNGVDVTAARRLQDRMAAALAAYEPASTGSARR